jgi:DNA (cytosine-5)-methyltransferase 1
LSAPLRILDAFAGIGGFSYAAEKLIGGFKTTQFIEIDPFCQSILKKHWPEVRVHDDIKSFRSSPGKFEVITAGFPCQDISQAGKQQGLSAERSGLFYEVIRLARELQPEFMLLENVGNLLSHQDGETFQEVLFQIAKAGFNAEWALIPASDLGACHQRKRVWIIAHSRQFHMEGCGSQGQQIQYPSSETGGTLWCRQGIEQLDPDWSAYVSEPVLRRGDDGLSGRVDRLKSLGNSIVPQVAAVALQRIRNLQRQRVQSLDPLN